MFAGVGTGDAMVRVNVLFGVVVWCWGCAGAWGAGAPGSTQTGADAPDLPKLGDAMSITLPGGVPISFVWVPSGSFLMGQQHGEQDAYPNKETPQHPVTISQGFWMGTCEVTKAQWRAVMGTEPWLGKRYVNEEPATPAVYVSWDDAQSFLSRAAEATSRPLRLATEAEWEYACRAGTATRFYWGDDPQYDAIGAQAWWRGNAMVSDARGARAVGTMPANPWGLFEMSGNVSEWCADWHWFYFDGRSIDPLGPSIGGHRVLRGGGWMDTGGRCRSSRRNHESPEAAHSDIGFRVVCAPAPPPQDGVPEFTEVFVAGMDGVNTYRIPAMVIAPDESVLVFCEARKESQADASPTDMVLRRSVDGGRTWLPVQTLVHGVGADALMNPCPVVDAKTNTIILMCDRANATREGHNEHYQLESQDNGVTWSEPVSIASRIANYDDSFHAGPGIGIQLRSGRLVVPGYSGEVNEETDEDWHARALYSDDHGKTWTMGAAVSQFTDECQAIELRDGRVMLNMRGNMGLSCRGVATSNDGGATWPQLRWDRALNECPCQAGIVRYSLAQDGGRDRILFVNPDNAGEKFNVVERTKLTVRMSYDEGETWPVKRLLHAGPASYSSIVRLPDGAIGVVFEGGEKERREWIRFARFSLAWLTDGSDTGEKN
ncbi:MAG: SUMF1/EgtB/PvdO family nonheme iron enzyme [Candidatus Hydrogenedentes bacterium]|nr:SUMF1/EgtB/PvdO family nonheme iron enzyme [Candidatus Hydrogenedentota bacterium]